MKIEVKVGNISQFNEARYCAGMGVDWIGFRSITSESFAEMADWLVGPQFVVEVDHIPETTIPNTLLEAPVAAIGEINNDAAIRLHVNEWAHYKSEILVRKELIQYAQLQLSNDEEENKRVLKELGAISKIYVLVEEVERLDYYLSLQPEGLALTGGMQEDYSHLSIVLEKLQEEL